MLLTRKGEMSLTEAAQAKQENIGLLAARRWNRILVDAIAVRSLPNAAEVFGLGKSLSRNLPRSARIGLVVRPDQAKHAKLIEQLAPEGVRFRRFSWMPRKLWLGCKALFDQRAPHFPRCPGNKSPGSNVECGGGTVVRLHYS